jgi:hypothetical protein
VVLACWSLTGGCGTTAVAVSLAILAGRRHGRALLVDVAGDAPAVLGVDDGGPGLAEWLAVGGVLDPPGRGWTAPVLDGGGGLAVVPRGTGPLRPRRSVEMLAHLLAADERPVVVDCGALGPAQRDGDLTGAGAVLARRAETSLLVMRACPLALRRLADTPVPLSGVIVLREPGRYLPTGEVEASAGAPVVAEVPYDPAVATAIETGDLRRSVPPPLLAALQPI